MSFKTGLLALILTVSIASPALASSPPSEKKGAEASIYFDWFANENANLTVQSVTDNIVDDVRHRLFTEYRPGLPVTDDSFFEKTHSSSGLCKTATEEVVTYNAAFRSNIAVYKDEHYTSLPWLVELSSQANAGCESLSTAIDDFLASRVQYNGNPAKYDAMGYLPERIKAKDLVVLASLDNSSLSEQERRDRVMQVKW